MNRAVCRTCKESKHTDDFPKNSTLRGHKIDCKVCYNEYQKNYYKSRPEQYEKHKSYVSKNDAIYIESGFKTNYRKHGISKDKYEKLLDRFNGLCWVCKTNTAVGIDHNHKCCDKSYSSGDCVRGVLCSRCNSMLGFSKDSKETLISALDYLKTRGVYK